jgi:hypothetical protein
MKDSSYIHTAESLLMKKLPILTTLLIRCATSQTLDLESRLKTLRWHRGIAVEVSGDEALREIVKSILMTEIWGIADISVVEPAKAHYQVRYYVKAVLNQKGDQLGIAVSEVWTWKPAIGQPGLDFAKTMKFNDPAMLAIADAAKMAGDLELVLSNQVFTSSGLDDIQDTLKENIGGIKKILAEDRNRYEQTRDQMLKNIQQNQSKQP